MQLEETSLVEKGLNRKEREWNVRGEEENVGEGNHEIFQKNVILKKEECVC